MELDKKRKTRAESLEHGAKSGVAADPELDMAYHVIQPNDYETYQALTSSCLAGR